MAPTLERRPAGRSPLVAAAALLIATTLVAACGGTATPAPSSVPSVPASPSAAASTAVSPSPSPSLSPSPFDAGAAFIRVMSDPALAGTVRMTGTMNVASTNLTVDGSASFHGLDNAGTLQLLQGTTVQQITDNVTVGTQRWKKQSPGPWLVDTTPANKSGLFVWLKGLTSVIDKGTQTRNGKAVHHLVPPADDPFPIEAFGAPSSVTGATTSADIYVLDDGTPVDLEVRASWTQTVSGTVAPVALDFILTFTAVGGTVPAITAPTGVWDVFTSTRFGYSMAHPADWVVTQASTGDKYGPAGQDVAFVSPQASTTKQDLAGFQKSLVAEYQKSLGAKPERDITASIGGEPCDILIYHFKNKSGAAVYLVDAVTIHGGRGWEVFLIDAAGSEDQDNTAFNTFVATFGFNK